MLFCHITMSPILSSLILFGKIMMFPSNQLKLLRWKLRPCFPTKEVEILHYPFMKYNMHLLWKYNMHTVTWMEWHGAYGPVSAFPLCSRLAHFLLLYPPFRSFPPTNVCNETFSNFKTQLRPSFILHNAFCPTFPDRPTLLYSSWNITQVQ